MPRRKNPTSDTDVAEKMNTPLAQRLNLLITDNNSLKDFLGCSIQAVNQYKLGISRPSIENLCKIADFYGVSTDYLLGRTENKTTNPKLQEVSEYTGISAAAAEYLHNSINPGRAHVLELLISHPWVIDNLHKYLFLNIDSVGEWDKDIRAKGGYKVVEGKYEQYAPLVDSKAGFGYPVDAALLGDAILLTIEGELRKLKEGIKNGQHHKND